MMLVDIVRDAHRAVKSEIALRRKEIGIIDSPTTFSFRRYQSLGSVVPVTCVTPEDGDYVHTFFDVCPFSPTRRFLAVTRIPFNHREPRPGDPADICVIDLGLQSIKTVYRTHAWGFQLGANLNWGPGDHDLFTNDMVNGEPVCVRIDLRSLQPTAFSGPMYHIAPDASSVISYPLDLINATQRGYGVPVNLHRSPSPGDGDEQNQGLWKTDLETNKKQLLVSIAQLLEKIPAAERERRGTYALFHSKFNPQGTRIMQVVRCLVPGKKGKNPQLFSFGSDGNNIRRVLSTSQWGRGHHPSWHPDGEHFLQNIPIGGVMRFCLFCHDGGDFRVLSEHCVGSGHPSIRIDGKCIITDAKPKESMGIDRNRVPIRLINLVDDTEQVICEIPVFRPRNNVRRLDPHPAWSRDYRSICFNGKLNGRRQVFIADLASILPR